jgi:hypothetical protein
MILTSIFDGLLLLFIELDNMPYLCPEIRLFPQSCIKASVLLLILPKDEGALVEWLSQNELFMFAMPLVGDIQCSLKGVEVRREVRDLIWVLISRDNTLLLGFLTPSIPLSKEGSLSNSLLLFSKGIVVRGANVGRFHGTTLFGTQNAVYHEASAKPENLAVVADPVLIWELFDPVTALVYRYVAEAAEHNHIFVFIVATVTYDTLSVLLSPMLAVAAVSYTCRLRKLLLRIISLISTLPLLIL